MSDNSFDMSLETDIPSMLNRADSLMQSGDINGAKQLVAAVLKQTKENADAWYLYGALVDDQAKKTQALQRALVIDPKHIRAQRMLNDVDPFNQVEAPPRTNVSSMQQNYGGPMQQMPPNAPYMQPNMIGQPQNYGGQMPMQQAPAAPIYINLHQNNTQSQNVNSVATPQVNQTALIIGFIGGFFWIYGIGHLFNGKLEPVMHFGFPGSERLMTD